MQLPDQDSLKINPHGSVYLDASGVAIEFATKKSYRRITYVFNGDKTHPEYVTVVKFMEFLQKQLYENYFWPHPID